MSGGLIDQIAALQAEALRHESTVGVQIPTWNAFAHGLVARTIFIPAGVVAFGAAHHQAQMNVCSGDITVYSEGKPKRYTGFHVIPSGPGTQRQGFAHADTWWVTIHANPDNCMDERTLERRFYAEADLMQTARMEMPALAMEEFQ